MFRTTFDKNLDTATSQLQLEPQWPAIILICDAINQKDTTPKAAFVAIKKKMNSTNPHTAYYALLVLESVVKNCGAPMHDEVFTKENCSMFSQYLESTTHENVRAKMLELVQTWAYAFRNSDKYQAIKDTMTILKTKGHPFPELKEADAMFAMDTAPNWSDGKKCHRCRDDFSFTNRKHHCRNCGQVFCGQCTSKQCPLPKFGIEKEVRVCDGCFAQLQRPSTVKVATARTADSDLPAEYLNSSLAQQVQTPPRKTEQELKEEEELQLALALSQSEAESKKQQQQQHVMGPDPTRVNKSVMELVFAKIKPFDGQNFDSWKHRVENFLEAQGVLDVLVDEKPTATATNVNDVKSWVEKNSKAKNLITCFVDENHLEYIKGKTTAKQMWAALVSTFSGTNMAKQNMLRTKLDRLRYETGSDMKRHFTKFDECVRELVAAGGKLENNEIIYHLFKSFPDDFQPLITVLENLPDEILTLEYAKSSLLNEEMWQKVSKELIGETSGSQAAAFYTGFNGKCFKCKKKGHKSFDCPQNKKNKFVKR